MFGYLQTIEQLCANKGNYEGLFVIYPTYNISAGDPRQIWDWLKSAFDVMGIFKMVTVSLQLPYWLKIICLLTADGMDVNLETGVD